MKDKNYVVKRDEIYVGDVCGINPEKIKIEADGLVDWEMVDFMLESQILTEDELKKSYDNQPFLLNRGVPQLLFHDSLGRDCIPSFRRSMLFVLDENKHANDLLYDSPHYPIFNISPNEDCLNSKICLLHRTYEIGKILKYFDYPEILTYEDIVKIRIYFFNCDFVIDNCTLFGRIDTGTYHSGYQLYDSKGNNRTFNGTLDDSIFPPCYFEALRENKDEFLPGERAGLKAIGRVHDSFIPNEKEGKIKSLHI